MSVISLPSWKSKGNAYKMCNAYKMFSEKKRSQAMQKTKVLVWNLFTQTDLMVLNIKKLHKEIVNQKVHNKKKQSRRGLPLLNASKF